VDEQLDLDGFESYERLGAGDGAGVAGYSAPHAVQATWSVPPSGMSITPEERWKPMGEAREVMDRLTAAATETKDFRAVAECYAFDAIAVTPDQGEIRGGEAIADYLRQFSDAFPDIRFEHAHKHEAGNVAIDEGYITGTHTAPLPMPSGESIPPTGKQIRVRDCDVATVEGGLVTSHHFYFDQFEFLGQLSLLPELPT
jgi:ketosteroid isomerase-like protein